MRTAGDEERRQRIKANGLECLGRLHGDQTWEDWMGVAAAMEIITEEALAASGSFKWDANDRRAVKEFNMRWDEYEAGAGRNYKPLSKQERWAVREVTSNPEISAYRAGLTGPEKRRLNHPNAVINRWKAREKAKATPAADKPPSAFEKMKRTKVELQEELHKVRKNSDGSTLTKDTMPKDAAITIIGSFDGLPSKVSRIESIARELLAWVKAQPSAPAPREPKAKAKQAKAVLVWKGSSSLSSAMTTGGGKYSISEVSHFPSFKVQGYHLSLYSKEQLANPNKNGTRESTRIGDLFPTLEKAKAAAEADYTGRI